MPSLGAISNTVFVLDIKVGLDDVITESFVLERDSKEMRLIKYLYVEAKETVMPYPYWWWNRLDGLRQQRPYGS